MTAKHDFKKKTNFTWLPGDGAVFAPEHDPLYHGLGRRK
jgi:hypothetical protein